MKVNNTNNVSVKKIEKKEASKVSGDDFKNILDSAIGESTEEESSSQEKDNRNSGKEDIMNELGNLLDEINLSDIDPKELRSLSKRLQNTQDSGLNSIAVLLATEAARKEFNL